MDAGEAAVHEVPPHQAEAAALLAIPPVADLLARFETGGDSCILVCGPHRVRSLLGTAGSPGLLPLCLARCAECALRAEGAICGLSAFFALPEPEGGSFPVLDLFDGLTRRECWEDCFVESFADVHRTFSALVRVLSLAHGDKAQAAAGAPEPGRAAPAKEGAGRLKKLFQRHLGRTPLLFRLSFLQEAAAGRSPGLEHHSLLFVDVPPAAAGGLLPHMYQNTASRLRSWKCCILHAAAGTKATSSAPLRSALGPLQLALDVASEDPRAFPAACIPRHLLEGERKAALRDLAHLLNLLEQWQASKGAPGGVPAWDAAEEWRTGFELRDITMAEVRRQLPLASRRAECLHRVLRRMCLLSEVDDLQFQELKQALEPMLPLEIPAACAGEWTPQEGVGDSQLFLELTSLAWQQQWQAQELLGHLDVAEERNFLRSRVSKLERALAARLAKNGDGDAEERRSERRERSWDARGSGSERQGEAPSPQLPRQRQSALQQRGEDLQQQVRQQRAERQLLAEVRQLEEGRASLAGELQAANQELRLAYQEQDEAERRNQGEAESLAKSQKHIEELTNELSEVCAYACQLELERSELHSALDASKAERRSARSADRSRQGQRGRPEQAGHLQPSRSSSSLREGGEQEVQPPEQPPSSSRRSSAAAVVPGDFPAAPSSRRSSGSVGRPPQPAC